MSDNGPFFSAVLDSLDEQIAVIDREGTAIYVNRAWSEFGIRNGLPAEFGRAGVNYLQACDASAAGGDSLAAEAARGIRDVLSGRRAALDFEYPCHSPDEKRWFTMRVTALRADPGKLFVISHHNITQRKLAEEKVEGLSRVDSLTGLSNRRHFSEFLLNEWQRSMRSRSPISLIMLDIDHFKEYNDQLGHLAGDRCLCRVSRVLQEFVRRPGDLVARYGGEEFSLVLGDTDVAKSRRTAEEIRKAIFDLDIRFGTTGRVSISAGVASLIPDVGQPELLLVETADKALYYAKQTGRNRVECAQPASGQ